MFINTFILDIWQYIYRYLVSENKSKYSSNRGIVYPYKSSSNSSENAENSKKSMEEEKKSNVL